MTAPAPTVWTTLSYKDARAGIEFLVKAFGFVEQAVYADESDPSVVLHAELLWPPGGGIMLGSARDESPVSAAGRSSAYCVVMSEDEVDAIHERTLAHGGSSVRPPSNPDYGGRVCSVADPEGNQWSFGTYRGEDVSE
jgi:uncharacterized glyoxalase superfamily protein PhnB